MKKTVLVIDYGMSNLRSVSKALEHVAGKDWVVKISDQADVIFQADKVVFPGQGAIGNCMSLLNQGSVADVIRQTLDEKPFLGICMGLQTLLTTSEESGGTTCFNWTAGTVRRFVERLAQSGERLKIPHMGWNQVQHTQSQHPLWADIPLKSWFYFVHSYYVDPIDSQVVAGRTSYNGINFASAVARDNVFAVQFHPEKSQQAGLTLLKNFLDW
ncbi:MAG: imidazole glycerol phosphate synthase subunit HisH [Gammaproteobacteria bacterium]|nr:MAG: imidazole glycerol phosphate synthase subunit HisH [Gammaproteobacteria bacterium]RKZ42238.1 MAG: imidazole glycerol phosphate synthase subunit HisH [Gammaproteobacteria bacterium]RKZ75887.1 MAG: imidazole glycerol phosphate synthase subunit HisH [Gammaproteobacteria bacterium]